MCNKEKIRIYKLFIIQLVLFFTLNLFYGRSNLIICIKYLFGLYKFEGLTVRAKPLLQFLRRTTKISSNY